MRLFKVVIRFDTEQTEYGPLFREIYAVADGLDAAVEIAGRYADSRSFSETRELNRVELVEYFAA